MLRKKIKTKKQKNVEERKAGSSHKSRKTPFTTPEHGQRNNATELFVKIQQVGKSVDA